MSNRWRVTARLAVAAIVGAFAVAAVGGTAAAHSRAGGQSPGALANAASAAQHGAGLPPSLRKSARWITLKNGQKVYGVPMQVNVRKGKVLAHPAAYGNCVYCFQSQNAGSGMCMSSYPNSQGSYVDQYSCTNAANQEWILATWTDNMPYLFAYNAPGLCLNNFQFQFSNGARMALWSCNSNSTAMWFDMGISNYANYYLIHLYKSFGTWSNQCVTVLPGRPSGSAVEQWTCDKTSVWQAFTGSTSPVAIGEASPPEWS